MTETTTNEASKRALKGDIATGPIGMAGTAPSALKSAARIETDKISAALAKAQAKIQSPSKDKTVKVSGTSKAGKAFNYNFKYATLDAVIDAVRGPLTSNEMWFYQSVEDGNMTTTLTHSSGQTIVSQLPMPAPDENREKPETPQELGSLLTYFKRYGLCAALGITAEEDDDANASEGNTVKVVEPSKEKKAADKLGKDLKGCTTEEGLLLLWEGHESTLDDIKKKSTIAYDALNKVYNKQKERLRPFEEDTVEDIHPEEGIPE